MKSAGLFLQWFGAILGLLWFLFATLAALVALAIIAQAMLDRRPFGQAVYMGLITALTVGYGDFVPRSRLSRCLSVLIGLLGIIFTGLVVAAAVSAATLTVRQVYGLPQ